MFSNGVLRASAVETDRATCHIVTEQLRGLSLMSLPLFLHPRPEVRLSSRYSAASYLNERLGELGVLPA